MAIQTFILQKQQRASEFVMDSNEENDHLSFHGIHKNQFPNLIQAPDPTNATSKDAHHNNPTVRFGRHVHSLLQRQLHFFLVI